MAKKHGVSRTTIKNEKDKKGWVKGGKPKKKGEVKGEVEEANEPPEFDRKFDRKFDKTVNQEMLPKRPEGCPTIKTPELLEAIFEAIAEGRTTRDICDEVGISRMTFYNWVRSDREFLYQYILIRCGRIDPGQGCLERDFAMPDLIVGHVQGQEPRTFGPLLLGRLRDPLVGQPVVSFECP